MDRVWEYRPRSARATLYSYVSRLRRALAGVAGIVQQSGGYRLTVDESAVDVHRFGRLVADARAIARLAKAASAMRREGKHTARQPAPQPARPQASAQAFAAALEHGGDLRRSWRAQALAAGIDVHAMLAAARPPGGPGGSPAPGPDPDRAAGKPTAIGRGSFI